MRRVYEPPPFHLGSIAEVGVFGQRVMFPAAGRLDGSPPPHARRSVEVEKEPGEVPAAVLDGEVAVEKQGLHARQQRIVSIQPRPASLDDADLGVGEILDHLAQDIARRYKVRIEDGDEFSFGDLESLGQSASLESPAVAAMEIAHAVPSGGILPDELFGNLAGFVGRVVEHLDFQLFARVVERRGGFEQPADDIAFVVERQLNRNRGQVLEPLRWHGRLMPVPQVEIDEVVTVEPVDGQEDQHKEVGNQNGEVKGVGAVETLKRVVRNKRLPERPEKVQVEKEDRECAHFYRHQRSSAPLL